MSTYKRFIPDDIKDMQSDKRFCDGWPIKPAPSSRTVLRLPKPKPAPKDKR